MWSRGPAASINCNRLTAVKLTKMRENCTEGGVATKSIRDRPLEPYNVVWPDETFVAQ